MKGIIFLQLALFFCLQSAGMPVKQGLEEYIQARLATVSFGERTSQRVDEKKEEEEKGQLPVANAVGQEQERKAVGQEQEQERDDYQDSPYESRRDFLERNPLDDFPLDQWTPPPANGYGNGYHGGGPSGSSEYYHGYPLNGGGYPNYGLYPPNNNNNNNNGGGYRGDYPIGGGYPNNQGDYPIGGGGGAYPPYDRRLPQDASEHARELGRLGRELGRSIADKLVTVGLSVGIDALVEAAIQHLLPALASGDISLPLAIAAFLLKIGIPGDLVDRLAQQITDVILNEWMYVSNQFRAHVVDLAKALVGNMLKTIYQALNRKEGWVDFMPDYE